MEVASRAIEDASPASPVISFEQAVKDYGQKKIGPVDLVIEKGEVMGFLGPNGSGKTTCIRLMLGLIRSSSGKVRINGFDPISSHTQALASVAYSPELPNLQTFLTPKELLSLVLHELFMSFSSVEREKEIYRVLELVGIREYADTKIGKLSKGMVQRLSVAQALIGEPKLLILDEPMIGLDPAGAAHFREIFREFARDGGGTVFMSSHIMSEVESLCSSVAIIHSGKIMIRGSVDEVIKKALDYSIVVLEAEGLGPSVAEKIRQLDGVVEIIPKNKGLEITVRGGTDIRPSLSQLVVSSGAKLYTVKQADNLLERAYIQTLNGKGASD